MHAIFAVATLWAVVEAWTRPSATCEVNASMVSSALLQSDLTIAQKAKRLPLERSSTRSKSSTSHISKFRQCTITRPAPGWFAWTWQIFAAKGTAWIHIYKNGGTAVHHALDNADIDATYYVGFNLKALVKDSLNLQDFFVATVVQDPLEHALSGLHETLKRKYCEDIPCAPHPKSKSEWVAAFRQYVQNNLNGIQPLDESHFLSQASFLASVDGVKYPMDYIGDLANLEEDTKSAFDMETLSLKVEHGPAEQPDPLDPNLFVLEVKDLPDDVVKLACEAYRDDYCCFDFSIPKMCDIAC